MKHHGGNRRKRAIRDRKAWRPNEVDQLRYDHRRRQRDDKPWERYQGENDDLTPPEG